MLRTLVFVIPGRSFLSNVVLVRLSERPALVQDFLVWSLYGCPQPPSYCQLHVETSSGLEPLIHLHVTLVVFNSNGVRKDTLSLSVNLLSFSNPTSVHLFFVWLCLVHTVAAFQTLSAGCTGVQMATHTLVDSPAHTHL